MKQIGVLLSIVMLPLLVVAEIPEGYYSKVKGLKKAELKSVLHTIISKAEVLDYGSGAGKTWTGFYTTDRYDGRKVRDRYSYDVREFSSSASVSSASAVSGMNIEHSFPKSWWGGANNQAYRDLFNLMPCEAKINSSKSNYAMGVVDDVHVDNGCTKVGTGKAGSVNASLWEPADEWKGDFARGYFYMVTAYSDLNWTSEGLKMLETNDWPTMQSWAYKLLLEWCRQDPVDEIEIQRNDAVYSIQGNRNPFVDFPMLAEYIWGDSINVVFNADGTSTVTPIDPDDPGVQPEDVEIALYNINFTEGYEGWTVINTVMPESAEYLWNMTTSYGMKVSGYMEGECHESESWLISPEFDLTSLKEATLTFNHTGKYFGDMEKEATLWISEDEGNHWKTLGINTYMSGNNWTFVENKTSIDEYCGGKVKIGFRYQSSDEYAGTWEVKTFSIDGKKGSQKTDNLMSVSVGESAGCSGDKVYDLTGRRVNHAGHGIYIINGRKVLR